MQASHPAQEELFLTLEETIRNVKTTFNSTFARHDFGISYDQWLVLGQVYHKQGISQHEICKNIVKEPASVSRIIKSLMNKDLILKLSDKKNKRANKIYLTHQGIELSQQIVKICRKSYEKQFKGIYERELNMIKNILNRINANQSEKTMAH